MRVEGQWSAIVHCEQCGASLRVDADDLVLLAPEVAAAIPEKWEGLSREMGVVCDNCGKQTPIAKHEERPYLLEQAKIRSGLPPLTEE